MWQCPCPETKKKKRPDIPGHNLHSALGTPAANKTYLFSLLRAIIQCLFIPNQDCSPSLPHIHSPTRNPIYNQEFPHAADHFRLTTSKVAHRTWHHMQRPSDIPKLLTEEVSTASCTLTNPISHANLRIYRMQCNMIVRVTSGRTNSMGIAY
ncbi:uncharacterized protein EAF01_001177 [Botrytis porri]|uniref:uncharacterized protein n=1 Tax=Botrytis porri TaxID=87229 RepID=UPI001902AAD7|nr:uncharacterized protein EAF01_001177 [Botrytis porri]KAF7912156.1 hypothetical protein EAF01_001177 [Botrytis porri]